MGKFKSGDLVKWKGQIHEMIYWPDDDTGFAQFKLDSDGPSVFTTENVGNLLVGMDLVQPSVPDWDLRAGAQFGHDANGDPVGELAVVGAPPPVKRGRAKAADSE